MNIKQFYVDAFNLQNPELLDLLEKISIPQKVKKGTIVVHQGDVQNDIPLLKSGLFQGFFCDLEGKEVLDCIVSDLGEAVVGASEFREPSPVCLQALVDSELICIPVNQLEYYIKKYEELKTIYIHLSLKAVEKHRKIKQALYQPDARSRYQWFRTNYGTFENQISQKKIASFLRVSEVWLSKIKHNN